MARIATICAEFVLFTMELLRIGERISGLAQRGTRLIGIDIGIGIRIGVTGRFIGGVRAASRRSRLGSGRLRG
jgi:hypothetical protein